MTNAEMKSFDCLNDSCIIVRARNKTRSALEKYLNSCALESFCIIVIICIYRLQGFFSKRIKILSRFSMLHGKFNKSVQDAGKFIQNSKESSKA